MVSTRSTPAITVPLPRFALREARAQVSAYLTGLTNSDIAPTSCRLLQTEPSVTATKEVRGPLAEGLLTPRSARLA